MRSITSLNNCKQLATGYLMYASDYHDTTLASAPNTNGVPLWVPGNVATLPDVANDSFLKNSPAFPHLHSTSIFHCPADESVFISLGQRTPRNRNYSLNAFRGPASNSATDNRQKVAGSIPAIHRMNTLREMTAPGPAAIFLLVDEHENSIDDAQFLPFADLRQYGNQQWLNCPAGHHSANAAGLAFADGHAEIHKWQDSNVTATQLGPYPIHGAFPRYAGQKDFAWWTNHIAAFR